MTSYLKPSQSHYKNRHMTNVYLSDSDEEAIVNFVKEHEELYDKNKVVNISRTKQGGGLCGRSSRGVASCLSRCVRPGLTRKGHVI